MRFGREEEANPGAIESKLPSTPEHASSRATLNSTAVENIEKSDASVTNYHDDLPAVTRQEGAPLQQWNHPKVNVGRSLVAFYGLIIMGANDAAYGAVIPYLEPFYNISYTVVSLIFLAPFLGYTASAFTNNQVHMRFGQRGIAFLGPGCRLTAYIIISQHPPYPALVLAYILAGYGNGLEDSAWNAWMGNMQNANEVLGFLHGAYGLGGILSPLIATAMITKAHLQWYTFYYIMIAAAAVELAVAVPVFWTEDGKKFRDDHPGTGDGEGGRTKEALSNHIMWICAFFLLVYVGTEVSFGGWVVVFMINIRHSTPFAAGVAETCFWLGITLGRVTLGFVTPRIGLRLAILIYLAIATALHLIFYLVPSIPVSFVTVTLEGFILGPMFPAAVVAATELLPPHLHVAGIGFAAAFGASGACILPFAVGAIANSKGVQVLMPIVLALIVADAAIWALLPNIKKGEGVRTLKARLMGVFGKAG